MTVRSLKDGLERLRKFLMKDMIAIEGNTPEEKLKTLGIRLDLSEPTQEYPVSATYHGPEATVQNKDLKEAWKDLSHRGPGARKARGLPETEEDLRTFLLRLEEEWEKRTLDPDEAWITEYLEGIGRSMSFTRGIVLVPACPKCGGNPSFQELPGLNPPACGKCLIEIPEGTPLVPFFDRGDMTS